MLRLAALSSAGGFQCGWRAFSQLAPRAGPRLLRRGRSVGLAVPRFLLPGVGHVCRPQGSAWPVEPVGLAGDPASRGLPAQPSSRGVTTATNDLAIEVYASLQGDFLDEARHGEGVVNRGGGEQGHPLSQSGTAARGWCPCMGRSSTRAGSSDDAKPLGLRPPCLVPGTRLGGKGRTGR